MSLINVDFERVKADKTAFFIVCLELVVIEENKYLVLILCLMSL